MDAERQKLQEEIEKKRSEFEATAKEIIGAMEGKERSAIKAKLVEAEIPDAIIKELLPVEAAAAPEDEKKEEPKEEKKEEKK